MKNAVLKKRHRGLGRPGPYSTGRLDPSRPNRLTSSPQHVDGDKLKLRLDNAESLAALSGINLYLDVPKAVLKVPKHFISAIRSLINSSSKPCRLEGQVAKGAFATVSHKPFDSLLNLLAAFRARNFER